MNRVDTTISPVNWSRIHSAGALCELLIVAAGFEDRALEVLRQMGPARISRVALIRFHSGPTVNDQSFEEAKRFLLKANVAKYSIVDLDILKIQEFEKELFGKASMLKVSETGEVWIDISALPTYAICVVLKAMRDLYPRAKIKIFYTEALEYYPTKAEYLQFSARSGGSGLETLPSALTTEMRENLILSSFAGLTIRQDKTCLLLFVGFEKHRSLGAIESMNPSKLVIIYGDPGKKRLKWRCNMSKELHENVISELERAEECVSTLNPEQSYDLLKAYYEMLYDDYSICVAPINSKMQTVASYLFWEKYRDVQLSFPLPIIYLPKRFSRGVGTVYTYDLPMLPGVEVMFGKL